MGARATMTTKGQITIPLAVRERLGLLPGDKMDIDVAEDGTLIARRVSTDLGSLIGKLSAFATGTPVGPDEIEAARAAEFDGTSSK